MIKKSIFKRIPDKELTVLEMDEYGGCDSKRKHFFKFFRDQYDYNWDVAEEKFKKMEAKIKDLEKIIDDLKIKGR